MLSWLREERYSRVTERPEAEERARKKGEHGLLTTVLATNDQEWQYTVFKGL